MKPTKRIFISLGILVALIIGFFIITSTLSNSTGLSVSDNSKNSSESCISKQNIILFINSADSDNTLKSIALTDYLQYFQIHNCFTNNQPCVDNHIDTFPTYILNGKKYVGDITPADLGKYTGCSG